MNIAYWNHFHGLPDRVEWFLPHFSNTSWIQFQPIDDYNHIYIWFNYLSLNPKAINIQISKYIKNKPQRFISLKCIKPRKIFNCPQSKRIFQIQSIFVECTMYKLSNRIWLSYIFMGECVWVRITYKDAIMIHIWLNNNGPDKANTMMMIVQYDHHHFRRYILCIFVQIFVQCIFLLLERSCHQLQKKIYLSLSFFFHSILFNSM